MTASRTDQIAVREAIKAHLAARPNRLQVPDHLKGKLYSPRDLLEHNIALQEAGLAEAMEARSARDASEIAALKAVIAAKAADAAVSAQVARAA